MNNDQNDITGTGRDHEADKKRLLDDLNDLPEEASSNPDDTAFESDSAEGLAQLNKDRLPLIIEQLNSNLRQQLKKKKKKTAAGLPDQSFVYITVITLLVLVIIAYIVVRKVHSV